MVKGLTARPVMAGPGSLMGEGKPADGSSTGVLKARMSPPGYQNLVFCFLEGK